MVGLSEQRGGHHSEVQSIKTASPDNTESLVPWQLYIPPPRQLNFLIEHTHTHTPLYNAHTNTLLHTQTHTHTHTPLYNAHTNTQTHFYTHTHHSITLTQTHRLMLPVTGNFHSMDTFDRS